MGRWEKERSRIMSNILLLEDDLSLINGLSFALRKQGYGLEVARTIKEVDTVWAEGKYDLLILDVSLPDLNEPAGISGNRRHRRRMGSA